MYREKDSSTILSYINNDEGLSIELSGLKCPHILNIALDKKPQKIELDGKELIEDTDFSYEAGKLKVKTTTYQDGNYNIQL